MSYSQRLPGQCAEIVYRMNWPEACPKMAAEGDTLCKRHRAKANRHAAQSAAINVKIAREMEQGRFIHQWREQHPLGTWVEPWICPLCGYAVQGTINEDSAGYVRNDIGHHQARHGADWTAYVAIGASPDEAPARRPAP